MNNLEDLEKLSDQKDLEKLSDQKDKKNSVRKDNGYFIEHKDFWNREYLCDLKCSECHSKFTLTIKDICQMLKVHRPWYYQHIESKVYKTYIANQRFEKLKANKRFEKLKNEQKAGYRYINHANANGSLLICEKSFSKLLKEKCSSVVRQTISLPFYSLMEFDKIGKYNNIKKNGEFRSLDETLEELENLEADIARSCVSESFNKITRKMPGVSYPLDEFKEQHLSPEKLKDMIHWVAPKDLVGYGDYEEIAYKKLLFAGCVRVEFNLGGRARVLYIDVDGLLKNGNMPSFLSKGAEGFITIPYAMYLKNKDKIDGWRKSYEEREIKQENFKPVEIDLTNF